MKDLKEAEEKFISRQGDVRDNFLYKLPFLAPKGFKPLEEH